MTETTVSAADGDRAAGMVDDLFRRESAHLVAALARLLGPSKLALAEDVVHERSAQRNACLALRPPGDPKAWILQVAKRRAIDVIRRSRRSEGLLLELALEPEKTLVTAVDLALSPDADAANQLAMMFAICDDALSPETHVTLILRLLCGLSPAEIARAFLVDSRPSIDACIAAGRACRSSDSFTT